MVMVFAGGPVACGRGAVCAGRRAPAGRDRAVVRPPEHGDGRAFGRLRALSAEA